MSKTERELKAELEDDCKCNDMVNNPPHYNQGGIETIDYMKAYSTHEEFCGHLRLTAIKYLSRTGKKDNDVQDLKKAQ